MTAFLSAPIWLAFGALAIPLLIVAASAYHGSEIYESNADPDADVATQQSVMEDGTVTQTITYAGSGSGAASVATFFGPFGFAVNVRPWAAIAVGCGLLLTATGLAGLLHFPTRMPVMDYSATGALLGGEQPQATDPAAGPDTGRDVSPPAR